MTVKDHEWSAYHSNDDIAERAYPLIEQDAVSSNLSIIVIQVVSFYAGGAELRRFLPMNLFEWMVNSYKNCSDLLWEKNVLVI